MAHSSNHPAIKLAQEYINSKLSTKITMNDLRAFTGYSERSLQLLFKNQFNKTPLGNKVKITDFFINGYKAFMCYYTIETYARKKGNRIYNASEVSMIDAFERKSLQDINS